MAKDKKNKPIFYSTAMARAIQEEMAADNKIVYMGEDVGAFGGTMFKNGLYAEYGETDRLIEMPIAENLIVGSALGMAEAGMRPVCELMYADFVSLAFDPICNEAAKYRFMSCGKHSAPMTIVTFQGTLDGSGCMHSQCVESWIANVPGLKIVVPTIASDAYGLFKTAIRDDDPVVFLAGKTCLFTKDVVPEEEYAIPFGKARIAKEGKDITIVSWQKGYQITMAAAAELEAEGISVEVIDPRTLMPFDKDTVLESVKKTGRFMVVHEAPVKYGVGAEIAEMVTENAFSDLKASPVRIGAPWIPIPSFQVEEQLLTKDMVIKAAKDLMKK